MIDFYLSLTVSLISIIVGLVAIFISFKFARMAEKDEALSRELLLQTRQLLVEEEDKKLLRKKLVLRRVIERLEPFIEVSLDQYLSVEFDIWKKNPDEINTTLDHEKDRFNEINSFVHSNSDSLQPDLTIFLVNFLNFATIVFQRPAVRSQEFYKFWREDLLELNEMILIVLGKIYEIVEEEQIK